MIAQTPWLDREFVLRYAENDTEESPWMTTPEFQRLVVDLLMSILGRYVRTHGLGWHLFSELMVIMRRGSDERTLEAGPDMFVVEADPTLRTSWIIEDEGKPPRFVLEVVTGQSGTRDLEEKPGMYYVMGVEEYAIFAPFRTDGPRLSGYRRDKAGDFIPWMVNAHGLLVSETLGGLGLVVESHHQWGVSCLRVIDQQGTRLPSEAEVADAADAAFAARRAAEAEVERLRALLRQRNGEPKAQ